MVGRSTSIFMHERAPFDRLKVISELFLEIFEILDWPGNNPDLNPFKCLWSYTKNQVAEKQSSRAKKKLVTSIKEVWVKENNLCVPSKNYG